MSKEQKFNYGGQAVIEGIMMRGKKDFAVAVRRSNGEIVVQKDNVESILGKLKFLEKPFLRGTLALIDAMALGIKALKYSADIAMADACLDEAAKNNDENPKCEAEPKKNSKINDMTVGITMVLGLVFGLAFFMLIPIVITKQLKNVITVGWELTVVEGIVKIGIFVAYVALISRMKDIRRVFQYHGAEHKTINAYEDKAVLTPENVMKYSKVHVRCGTSFILIVLITSIVVFMGIADHLPHGSLTDKSMMSIFMRWMYKLILMPFVAGIAYEIIKLAGKKKDSMLTKILTFPGLLMQRITTREPDLQMVEIAIVSLNTVLDLENDPQEAAVIS